MSKAKKVKAGKLYTNGRAQVVCIEDEWPAPWGEQWCRVAPIQNVRKFNVPVRMPGEEVLKYWPYVVDRIVIEQEDLDPGMKPGRKR